MQSAVSHGLAPPGPPPEPCGHPTDTPSRQNTCSARALFRTPVGHRSRRPVPHHALARRRGPAHARKCPPSTPPPPGTFRDRPMISTESSVRGPRRSARRSPPVRRRAPHQPAFLIITLSRTPEHHDHPPGRRRQPPAADKPGAANSVYGQSPRWRRTAARGLCVCHAARHTGESIQPLCTVCARHPTPRGSGAARTLTR